MVGETEFDLIDDIGGIDLKTANFSPASKSNWLEIPVRRAAKKVKIGVQDVRTTRSNSGSKS